MTVAELYHTMTTDQLLLLREAFILDRDAATRLSTVTFCQQRLQMIEDEVLARVTAHGAKPHDL